MIAYHFVGETLRDGRPVPEDGVWLEHDGPVKMCASGLHASLTPWDALQYAPGHVLCEVEVDGIDSHDTDKLVARRRRILRRVDLTDDLRAFARAEASSVLHLWDAPQVVRDYIATGDESLRSDAWSAAWAAESDAARSAASAAARSAAWSAARSAASAAARSAAWAASGQRFNAMAVAKLGKAGAA